MRLRKTGSLSQLEREEISRGLVAGFSYCSIGKLLGRAPSTISREVARNGSRKTYRAMSVESNALQRSLRPKLCYVAAVIDLFSRRVVGWSMSATMTAQLVTHALLMAIC